MAASILTVDDASTMRRLISFTLTRAGYEVSEAADGPAALSLLIGGRFDLIITDVNMPQMSGIDLTRRIRAMPNYRRTPILVLTTESEAKVKTEARAAGATGWIVKPFQPEQLVSVVSRVLAVI